MILVIKHVISEGPGLIYSFFREQGFSIKVIELEKGESLPHNFDGIEAVVIMGGPMNVYEEKDFPFLRKETLFLFESLKRNIPMIGICLGAQMLAKASGAKVNIGHCYEKGWSNIELTDDGREDVLFYGLSGRMDVFQWHNDEFQIPEGAVLLANSHKCPNQAVRINTNVYALQFHIEVTPSMVESWCRDDLESRDEVKRRSAEIILRDTPGKAESFKKQAWSILSNFKNFVLLNKKIDFSSKL